MTSDLHFTVIDMQDLRRFFHFPRFAILHHHPQEDVVILCRFQSVSNKHSLKRQRPGKDLIANDIAFVEQRREYGDLGYSGKLAGWE
ncbi:Uncharacterised protein [Escherichia coli]|uniref:Uncharacterized protein n=1 Tax=Escherichia coli TaxID=562 RepID=A0A376P8S5_ECOLX|nr:Uncharacterised protein [Escherichia coli]